MTTRRRTVVLSGVRFDGLTEREVIDTVLDSLAARRGGRIVTPNVDILRRAMRSAEAREHIESASLVMADGAPLIWAARVAGQPLPARVPGSDLIWSISGALAGKGYSVYLLGGEPGTSEVAAAALAERYPGIAIAGHSSPPFGFDTHSDQYDAVCAEVIAARPDFVYVGLGFPKQERVIARLRGALPGAWFMGCGAAIGFVAGTYRRAPRWMQRTGLEWVHRLALEPGRLVRRYLIEDAPFAARLLAGSALARLRKGSRA
ncbi:WecB/TagA/CpsF family glycosyltransferase [Rhizomonospora bruguierae]|uniref:WecB/TagA/CpsF family glycosyltransferase n=1 Tax=Rhizomonospora bruguierae TaxID=1581705 RepID=UPI001BCABFBA|nr:WecB/TagA/CpsF family glycosyltransferase [Micromonospora sp. NBRC 107566]